jgi:aromatic ring-opening dioxygenase catalytic subunit (LigB family)
MAELVEVLAASHGPLIQRDWDKVAPAHKERLTAAFRALGARLRQARPDVLLVVTPDHWINFFIDNLPNVCIGVGEAHEGPPEPFLKDFPWRPVPGHPGLANHIYATALDNDFEPSVSHHMTLDHGACLPLWRMELEALPKIVPVLFNTLEPPMLRVRRCLA